MNQFHWMVHNLAGHIEDEGLRRISGKTAIRKCIGGWGVLNEIDPKDVRFYRKFLKQNELKWRRRGQLAVIWDPEVFEFHGFVFRRIMKGGHVGADGFKGRGEERRVGPNRYMLKWKGAFKTDKGPDVPVVLHGTHLMAKSDTEHRWRRPLFSRSIRNAGRFIRRSMRRYPNGMVMGDLNKKQYVDWPFVDERRVITPPDFGKLRYTQVHTFGGLRAVNVREFHTPSDHDGIEGDAVITKAALDNL